MARTAASPGAPQAPLDPADPAPTRDEARFDGDYTKFRKAYKAWNERERLRRSKRKRPVDVSGEPQQAQEQRRPLRRVSFAASDSLAQVREYEPTYSPSDWVTEEQVWRAEDEVEAEEAAAEQLKRDAVRQQQYEWMYFQRDATKAAQTRCGDIYVDGIIAACGSQVAYKELRRRCMAVIDQLWMQLVQASRDKYRQYLRQYPSNRDWESREYREKRWLEYEIMRSETGAPRLSAEQEKRLSEYYKKVNSVPHWVCGVCEE